LRGVRTLLLNRTIFKEEKTKMAQPEKIILVCNNKRPEGHPRGCCIDKGAADVTAELGELLDDKDLLGRVRLAKTGCIGPCSYGPIVAVMPDNVWYKEVTKEDVKKIVEEHIEGGNPVKQLMLLEEDWT